MRKPGRMRRLSKAAWLLTFVVVFVFGASTAAFAYLQKSVTATAGAKAQQVLPPAAPAATCVSSATKTVTISWSPVAHATGYTVTGTLAGVGADFTTTTPATSVTTGPLAQGTWTFTVSTHISQWTSTQSSPSVTRTISTASTPHCS